MRDQTLKWGAGASVAGAAVLALSALALSPATGQASNEGTIKINETDADDFPANDPHVGCVFDVGFFGYPEEAADGDVVFSVQPPTGDEVIFEATVAVGGDAAGGANDEDAVVNVDLTDELAGFEPHPQQGFHIKLDVDAPNTQGGPKSKVFWVVCEAAQPTTTITTTTSTTTTSTTAPTTTTTAPTTTTTVAPTTSTTEGARVTTTTTHPGAPAPQAPAPPGGRAPAAPQAPAAPHAPAPAPAAAPAPSGQLAVTGSSTSILAGVGAVLLLVGAGLTLVARRRFAA
jgi:LPXTG-motif cell wall-anchored protein